MVNYKDLGLVNTREMFAKAIKGGNCRGTEIEQYVIIQSNKATETEVIEIA